MYGECIDPRIPGGIREEALRRASAPAPPAPPAAFRIWQEVEDRQGVRIEEISENEEVEQRLRADTKKEEPIVVESDDDEQDGGHGRARDTMERMEDLLAKIGRYQDKLTTLCEEVNRWKGELPLVYLIDSGPGAQGGCGNLPGVTVTAPTPRSGMTFRPPSRAGRAALAARTRSKGAPDSSHPTQDSPGPSGEKEMVEIPEDDEDEDEKLRKEEDKKAEERAKKRGAKTSADKEQEGKKRKYKVRMEEGFDVEGMVDRLLEGHNDLMNLKDILASAPKLRDELKARLSRRLVASVRLGTIIPKEAEWAETGTKMDWKSVACGCLDVVVKGKTCTTMVDTGEEINLIKEEHALRLGMEIDRSDNGVLMGANSRSVFIGTASRMVLEFGKVKVRSCFFVMPDLDHPILLGRSFFSRTETVILNKHDGTMFLVLCDPVCGNYEVITCKNTGPQSIRNRPNPGSFTIEESGEERKRLGGDEFEEERNPEALTLSLTNIGDAMKIVSTYGMADMEAVEALREKVMEQMGEGEVELVYWTWDKMARVRKEPLKVGDVVLLYDSSLEKQWSRKLDKRWLGPYRVARSGEHGTYQIEELNGTAWKDWVSGSRLKKFVARDEDFERKMEGLHPSPLGRDGQPIRFDATNLWEFLKGYDEFADSINKPPSQRVRDFILFVREHLRSFIRSIVEPATNWSHCKKLLWNYYTPARQAEERRSVHRKRKEPETAEKRTSEQGMTSGAQRDGQRREHRFRRQEREEDQHIGKTQQKEEQTAERTQRGGPSGGSDIPPHLAHVPETTPRPGMQPETSHRAQGQGKDEDQAAREKEQDKEERAAIEREIRVQIKLKNIAELHEKFKQGEQPGGPGRPREQHQEMGVKLVSTDLLSLKGLTKEGFAAAKTSNEKMEKRLTRVARASHEQRMDWQKEIGDLKKELERQDKEMEAIKTEVEKAWAGNEAIRQVNQTLNKVEERANDQKDEEIPLLDKKMLQSEDALAKMKSGTGGFEWRMPTVLAHEARPPAEDAMDEAALPVTQEETVGRQEVQESVGQAMAEAEEREEQEVSQKTPPSQDMPLVAGLEDALGSWATGSGAEERVSEQMAQTDDRAACPISPEHPQQEVTSEATATPSSVPSHAADKMEQKRFGRCFYCKRGKHPQETCPKSLKDEADGLFSWDPSGVRRDRDGNLILKTRDGIRAQLYRQLQEDMSDQE
ncbi:hypothetical protein CBR_g32226 [Chara braunii]|uniref:Peptidase A2 domain-containing protein n=1 Tax=Chara braunii TaxID=69332 RepID=A0A388JN03_CHABU|nr:hypothetical protein CBR_g32226 [Chara braunii]|eukprot:GBG59210.1 hypothetical protein CBR_g32226 [Chara braunii]